jgi:hypothetical protein
MNQVILHCPHCGAQNRNESYFCHICGSTLRSDSVRNIATADPWRIPLISLCSALGVVAFFSLIANIALLSQKPTQNIPSATPASLYQPVPVASPTPLPSPSPDVVAKKPKAKRSPSPSEEYVVPMGEPEFEPTPYRPEVRSVPRSTPYPEPTTYYSPTYGKTYIRGPRGGCYYINRNGNKTYVDRSMCN